jgi:uncharacterized membrane protein YeaQ/YmgE (transglycosylase-associated protein family)
MDLLALLIAGIVAGNVSALFFGGYSLGAVGNSIAGLTGALFLSNYVSQLFGLSKYPSQICAGMAGAVVILVVFRLVEFVVVNRTRKY